jgi:hypothetical protein
VVSEYYYGEDMVKALASNREISLHTWREIRFLHYRLGSGVTENQLWHIFFFFFFMML